jgi:NAD+ diphosphatase
VLISRENQFPFSARRATALSAFAFASSPLDRLAQIRAKPEEVEKHLKSNKLRCVWVHWDGMRFAGDAPDYTPSREAVENVFLGCDLQGFSWFAARAKATDSLKSIRSVMIDGVLPKEELSIVAQARSLIHWHDTHGFCAKCGAASRMADAGYRRHCDTCGADHFPRTDPVVIMAVTHVNKALLGRQSSWPENMYSVLAGFMEPGETIEDAVRREVREEVGIEVGRVEYVASQPWPFPSSLMVGMIGEAKTDILTVDTTEIETARWFEAEELKQMLFRTHPQGFYASRPDAIAFHLAKAALKKINSS